jgi:N-acetylmuramate 1-kinase
LNSVKGAPLLSDEGTAAFLAEHLPGYTGAVKLEGDASARTYYRVFTDATSYVLCYDRAFVGASEKDYPFLRIYRLLKDAVPLPRVYSHDAPKGLLLIQDLGEDPLEHSFPRLAKNEIIRIYETCLDHMFSIQAVRDGKGVPFSLGFDIDKLMFEFDFFIEHALFGYFKAPLNQAKLRCLKAEFLHLAGLLAQPSLFVLCHRDYHSRNIMIHDRIPYIIDFQDARMGLPLYDAVSLLRDSYLTLETDVFGYLKNYCFEGGRDRGVHGMARDEFDYYFDIMAFQRNIKALGTFGYQYGLGNARYEKYIKPTVAYLDAYAGRQPELKKSWGILSGYFSDLI